MLPAGMIHSQVPGTGIQHQVQVQDPYPYPNLITRAWLPIAET